MSSGLTRSLLLPLVAGTLLLAACTPPPAVPVENGRGGQPLNTTDPPNYPSGPYGFISGDVLPNLAFVGRADDNGDGTIVDNPVRRIRVSDYFQDPKIKVLALLVAAEWCGPCQQEQWELVDSFKKFQAADKGVAYVEALIQSTNRDPADIDTVDRWAGHKWPKPGDPVAPTQIIPFPVVADPTVELGPWYITPAFPMQLLMRTDDMTIQWQNNGYAKGALEGNIDGILGE